ncbi:MAG: DUF1214 domain-containing protein [Dinoroseobacter sp.]|nr:DUF1214 domain-containing protein [Dinoroseobacter sp.]
MLRNTVVGAAFGSLLATVAVAQTVELDDAELRNLVERSYQYVAMYNVNNKFAESRGGWNTVLANTELADHTFTDIARPNNDSLYITAMLDLRAEPMILQLPAFDSNYVSIMMTGYDHYVIAPMSTRLGDFAEPETVLLYTERTQGYSGEPVEGVDRVMEMTGDFVSALMRVMPHANDPERFDRIIGEMQSVELVGLSEFLGQTPPEDSGVDFLAVGATDADIFGTNLFEVIQFAFNHTTFDPSDPLDVAVLKAWEPFGVVPGGSVLDAATAEYDRDRFRAMSETVAAFNLGLMEDPDAVGSILARWGNPKGGHTLESILAQSVIGPIPLPPAEAAYPPITTSDGSTLNSANDYVIRMSADELPPANAFWSITLYDLDQGFFIPNEQFKYSVGENAGYMLDENGGIEIHIAAEQPEGVPAENWLPINRDGIDLSANLRIYAPDLERMETWTPPLAEPVK